VGQLGKLRADGIGALPLPRVSDFGMRLFDTTFQATMGLQDRGTMKPTPCSGPVYTASFERRSFIQVGVLGGLGLTLADLFSSTARASVVRSEADANKRRQGRGES